MSQLKARALGLAPLWILNLNAFIFTPLLMEAVLWWYARNRIDHAMFDMFVWLPGLYIVTWCLLVDVASRIKWWGFSKSDRVRLRTQSLLMKFLLGALVFFGLAELNLNNLPGTYSYPALFGLIFVTASSFWDKKLTERTQRVSQLENLLGTAVFFFGLAMIIYAIPFRIF